jgi:hypothetical protein
MGSVGVNGDESVGGGVLLLYPELPFMAIK